MICIHNVGNYGCWLAVCLIVGLDICVVMFECEDSGVFAEIVVNVRPLVLIMVLFCTLIMFRGWFSMALLFLLVNYFRGSSFPVFGIKVSLSFFWS